MQKVNISTSSLIGGLAAFVLSIFSATPLYVGLFALFLGPVSKDLHWNLATFPQGMLAYSICFAVGSPFAGRISDILGVRFALLVGIAFTTCGLAGLSFMTGSMLHLYVVSSFLGIGGSLVGATTLARPVASYFETGRGLAMGIIFGAGPMIAGAALSPIVSATIANIGWRPTYQGLALLSVVLSVIMVLTMPKPAAASGPIPGMPGDASAGEDLQTVFRDRNFWLILIASTFLPIVFGGVTGHLVAMAAANGLSASFGAAMLSASSLAGVVGPVAAGALADRLNNPKAFLPFLAAPIIGFVALLFKVQGIAMILSAGLIGLGFSAWSGQTALLVTRYFGLRATGAVVGIVFGVGGVFLGLGPVVMGFLRTGYGTYTPALLLAIVLQAIAVVLVALLGPFVSFAPNAAAAEPVADASLPRAQAAR